MYTYTDEEKCEEKEKFIARSLKIEKGKIQSIMCTAKTYIYIKVDVFLDK
jgi:hypothetical protein